MTHKPLAFGNVERPGKMSGHVSVRRKRVDDFEVLREAIHTSTSDIVQIDKGRMNGSLAHISFGNFSLSAGSFSLGVRSQGIFDTSRVTFGVLLNASDSVCRMSREMRPGDIGVTPPGKEHQCRYYGSTSFAAISVSADELFSMLEAEPSLTDLRIWQDGTLLRADPKFSGNVIKRLNTIVSWISEHGSALSPEAGAFWKRSMLEFVLTSMMRSYPVDPGQKILSAALFIRRVEDYLDFAGSRPVHISEICTQFHVSRRTLHRAFHEVLGVGPLTFLRHKRLCAVHSALRDSDPWTATVAEVAMQQGFIELGRFSHYYRSLFGEYPSQTLGGRNPGNRTCITA